MNPRRIELVTRSRTIWAAYRFWAWWVYRRPRFVARMLPRYEYRDGSHSATHIGTMWQFELWDANPDYMTLPHPYDGVSANLLWTRRLYSRWRWPSRKRII